MPITTIFEDGTLTALLSGDIDHHSATVMRQTIDRAIESSLPQKLVIDFKEISFMDSSGIGLIMGRYKLMKSINGDTEVINASPYLKKIMKLAGLELLAIVK